MAFSRIAFSGAWMFVYRWIHEIVVPWSNADCCPRVHFAFETNRLVFSSSSSLRFEHTKKFVPFPFSGLDFITRETPHPLIHSVAQSFVCVCDGHAEKRVLTRAPASLHEFYVFFLFFIFSSYRFSSDIHLFSRGVLFSVVSEIVEFLCVICKKQKSVCNIRILPTKQAIQFVRSFARAIHTHPH